MLFSVSGGRHDAQERVRSRRSCWRCSRRCRCTSRTRSRSTSLVVFHVFMAAIVAARGDRQRAGADPGAAHALAGHRLRAVLLRRLAAFVSRSAIAASTHLVLFIAAYQPIEALQRNNQAQRMLTAALIFTASLATSTHITIVPFVLVVRVPDVPAAHVREPSGDGRARSDSSTPSRRPARAAAFYLAGAIAIGALLFPLLPRVRNPFVRGLTGPLPARRRRSARRSTSREQRVSPNDATVVARVWIDRETRPFFTPLRLRGTIYDRFDGGEWRQTHPRPARGAAARRASSGSRSRAASPARRSSRCARSKGRLFLPVGTYALTGLTNLYEGPTREAYYTYDDGSLRSDGAAWRRSRSRCGSRASACPAIRSRRRWRRWRARSSATEQSPRAPGGADRAVPGRATSATCRTPRRRHADLARAVPAASTAPGTASTSRRGWSRC